MSKKVIEHQFPLHAPDVVEEQTRRALMELGWAMKSLGPGRIEGKEPHKLMNDRLLMTTTITGMNGATSVSFEGHISGWGPWMAKVLETRMYQFIVLLMERVEKQPQSVGPSQTTPAAPAEATQDPSLRPAATDGPSCPRCQGALSPGATTCPHCGL